jgi:hypothetical protein
MRYIANAINKRHWIAKLGDTGNIEQGHQGYSDQISDKSCEDEGQYYFYH